MPLTSHTKIDIEIMRGKDSVAICKEMLRHNFCGGSWQSLYPIVSYFWSPAVFTASKYFWIHCRHSKRTYSQELIDKHLPTFDNPSCINHPITYQGYGNK